MMIRLPLSVDHQKKRAIAIQLPYGLYLQFVSSPSFQAILPESLREKAVQLKKTFFKQNSFFSEDYRAEYEKSPYIRFITGADLHKFFVKLLSLNYQQHKETLSVRPGSFEEFFADYHLFWNAKYKSDQVFDEDLIRQALFCAQCIETQYARFMEHQKLSQMLGDYAKSEIAARDEEIKRLKNNLSEMEGEAERLEQKNAELQARLDREIEKKMVLVPSDPFYMLGLEPGNKQALDARSKVLLKALHPDKTGTDQTGYLFDLILKARDMASKS